MAAIVITLKDINPSAENSIYLNADAPLVSNLTFVEFAPAPNGPAGEPRVELTLRVLARLFLPRCRIGFSEEDRQAARTRSALTLRLVADAWTRIVTEYAASGLFDSVIRTLPLWDRAISSAIIINPTNLELLAADWAPASPFSIPTSNAAAHARRRAVMQQLSFIHGASVAALCDPHSTNLPMLPLALLTGAIGSVGTDAARAENGGHLALVAETLRNFIGSDSSNERLSASLCRTISHRRLPFDLRAHITDAQHLREELEAGFEFQSPNCRESIESSRVHFLDNGCDTRRCRPRLYPRPPPEPSPLPHLVIDTEVFILDDPTIYGLSPCHTP